MLNVYYANRLENHKDLLVSILQKDPDPNPFSQETILVQSTGMAQWLQMQIAESIGITGNIQFPYPTTFLWQQYRLLFPELPKENIFDRHIMVWHLIKLLPKYLSDPEFKALAFYLTNADQLKYYQLAVKIADLFDQYLVYRPHWLVYWENNQAHNIIDEIKNSVSVNKNNLDEIKQSILWQGILWNSLVAEIKANSDEIIFNTSHRAYLQQRYFEKLDNLTNLEKENLPKRIFVFGISALPATQLLVIKKLSQYCQVHLFFTNPSKEYWAEQKEDKIIEKLSLNQDVLESELEELLNNQGNPLLSSWGKQGKEFLNLILESQPDQEIEFYQDYYSHTLLNQIKQGIFNNQHKKEIVISQLDNSLQIHSCHSKMREVEVLHNQLLKFFEQDNELAPKDIIVMSPDIDSYAPYINSVFSRYQNYDNRYIPFAISDQKISYIEPIISSFLLLLSLKENRFSTEEVLELFSIHSIREKYQINEDEFYTLKEWVVKSGIRSGLKKYNQQWQNYNSWENGLNRLLLGISLKEENHIWQGVAAFDESYGLISTSVGYFAKFIEELTAWYEFLSQPHSSEKWQDALSKLVSQFYVENDENSASLTILNQAIEIVFGYISQANFDKEIDIDIIYQLFLEQLSEKRNNLNFLVGKVNFCTLLPMRAIPFKVVCLLGMNEGEFPRQQLLNNFDLMQYAYQKGDRSKRDDDRYLFLESLLSAQNVFYISYIGKSLTNNQEKLPSILVSQLLDYIKDNLSIQEIEYENRIEDIYYDHPMTLFSKNNAIGNLISYDKEWINIKDTKTETEDFINEIKMEKESLIQTIFLDDLIAYLQNPVKFYFNKILGVNFEQYNENMEESEIFSLSGLEKYQLESKLIEIPIEQQKNYFEIEKLKGNLPHCHFEELSITELSSKSHKLRDKIQCYLNQEKHLYEIDCDFCLGEHKVKLEGYIPNQFDNEIVLWRVGRLRDKDIILAWVYFLLLRLSTEKSVKFYFIEKEVRCLLFNNIEPKISESILLRYLNDYLISKTRLQITLVDNIVDYVEKNNGENLSILYDKLVDLDNIYLKRVLYQQGELDLEDIHQRTLSWFDLMVNSQEIK